MWHHVMCFRVHCVLWARGQLGQVLLGPWFLTAQTPTTPDRLGLLDLHSEWLQL